MDLKYIENNAHSALYYRLVVLRWSQQKNYSLRHLLFLYDWAIFQPQFYELEINDVISKLVKNKKKFNCQLCVK